MQRKCFQWVLLSADRHKDYQTHDRKSGKRLIIPSTGQQESGGPCFAFSSATLSVPQVPWEFVASTHYMDSTNNVPFMEMRLVWYRTLNYGCIKNRQWFCTAFVSHHRSNLLSGAYSGDGSVYRAPLRSQNKRNLRSLAQVSRKQRRRRSTSILFDDVLSSVTKTSGRSSKSPPDSRIVVVRN